MKKESTPNRSIHCTVKDCKFHHGDENFCALDEISVATDEQNPKDEKCVDCKSFECRSTSPSMF